MKKNLFAIICYITEVNISFAALARPTSLTPTKEKTSSSEAWMFDSSIDFLMTIAYYLLIGALILVWGYVFIKTIRFLFELFYSKNLRYLKVTLPRADSKLDKEKETKKDFKEKIWMMSMFYKAIHKLSEA